MNSSLLVQNKSSSEISLVRRTKYRMSGKQTFNANWTQITIVRFSKNFFRTATELEFETVPRTVENSHIQYRRCRNNDFSSIDISIPQSKNVLTYFPVEYLFSLPSIHFLIPREVHLQPALTTNFCGCLWNSTSSFSLLGFFRFASSM